MERSLRAPRETSNGLHMSLSKWNPDDPQWGKLSWKRVQLLSGDFETPENFKRCFHGICAILEAGQANLWGDGRRSHQLVEWDGSNHQTLKAFHGKQLFLQGCVTNLAPLP